MLEGSPATGEWTYEEALSRLESIVASLERGDLDLEESMRRFEEGIRCSRLCAERLTAAEARIRKLVETEEGDLRLEPAPVEG